ncbi:potassium-transporting ATPase subunit C [Enterococcus sp. HY326]|uniref:potassium-transporting ATPase subunit C n=1 Tax=Enterococcus sp. HY326 TaxID=2971265 RepID=UPI00224069CB|nr:potassium-transporting ATPase subunit C [Enterococcus sp. HY326]
MKQTVLASLRFLVLAIVVFGGLYTLVITGVGQTFFSEKADGSLIVQEGKVVGSKLIGQDMQAADYFQGRPTEVSNLAVFSAEQASLVAKRKETLLTENPTQTEVPLDLVTASASGVDPDISLAAAEFQVARIANQRNLSEEAINAIIKAQTQRDFLSNRAYVNVLALNLALDKLSQE